MPPSSPFGPPVARVPSWYGGVREEERRWRRPPEQKIKKYLIQEVQGAETSNVQSDEGAQPGVGSPLDEHTDKILVAVRDTKMALEQKIETAAQDVGLPQAGHRKLVAKVGEAKCSLTELN
ncbi:hypothetical protein NDU88_006050 [Pleurodeles waltl]|uniref:Uncharacterized protein n=1 Tax=Pleurodeles waltl TaxID=8319 RepID=A0AAV7X014_PLEWA|nr:hypothetical protein NDU88_006050 [Pleurodeles waltl]